MRFSLTKFGAAIVSAALLVGQAAWAAPITPGGDTFGTVTTLGSGPVTFGGSGIPTDSTVISTFMLGNETIRIGMSATPRFSSPALGNDGIGTFTTTAGESDPGLSKWNFSFFVESTGLLNGAGIKLYYDFDPAAGTDLADMGIIDISAFLLATAPTATVAQDSQNLGFPYLATSSFFVSPPTFPSFDLFAAGEYSFKLVASNGQGVAMNVNVAAVPLPAGLPLLLGALSGLVWLRRRKT